MRKTKEPIILVESNSPITPIQAFVEENENNIYFYLWVKPNTNEAEMRACWVCNTKKAPIEMDSVSMENGMAPMLHAEFCKNPDSGETIDRDNLSIVWLPDGDGAALLEGEKILSCIPGWCDEEFRGYSRFCKGESFVAWEMNDECEQNLMKNVERAKKFWEYFNGDFWPEYQTNMLNTIDDFFDEQKAYYAIDGGKFPPKALVAGRINGDNYACTLGASLFPQPKIEMYFGEEASDYERIEIAVASKHGSLDEESIKRLLNFTASLAHLPWYELSWLGHGHTVDCGAINGFPQAMLVSSSMIAEILSPRFPDFMGDRVNVLWIVPLTKEEFEKCSMLENGSRDLLKNYDGDIADVVMFDGKPKFIKA